MKNLISNNMKYYAMYLRKSRKDIEAEEHGQGETLVRHERILIDLANSMNIKISKTYKEIVSGETIASRPAVQQLLTDVENGLWEGVFVVEVERLARGNTLDQGIVSNAFQYSGTKIITPSKIYDPNNEFDEEYFEFGLFMSRREYKTINRRLHSGIIASANEGKHVGAAAPYGYDKYKLPKQKGFSLRINEEESKIIRFIFSSYINGVGIQTICNKLTNLGVKPKRSDTWGTSTITHILTNPVYIGKIQYTDKSTKKKNINGKIVRVKNDNPEIIFVDGLHEPIIDIPTWEKVKEVRKGNLLNRTKVDYTLKNPMSSLLKCGFCGKALSRITYSSRNDVRLCCRHCSKNIGSNIDYVEDKLLQSLKLLLNDYKIKLINKDNSDIDLMLNLNYENKKKLQEEESKTNLQLNNLYDLLEQGVYSKETFIERLNILKSKLSDLESQINKIDKECAQINKNRNNKEILIPKIETVINTYYSTDDINLKNKLLKSVLQKVEYYKQNPKNKDDFKLILFPKLY